MTDSIRKYQIYFGLRKRQPILKPKQSITEPDKLVYTQPPGLDEQFVNVPVVNRIVAEESRLEPREKSMNEKNLENNHIKTPLILQDASDDNTSTSNQLLNVDLETVEIDTNLHRKRKNDEQMKSINNDQLIQEPKLVQTDIHLKKPKLKRKKKLTILDRFN